MRLRRMIYQALDRLIDRLMRLLELVDREYFVERRSVAIANAARVHAASHKVPVHEAVLPLCSVDGCRYRGTRGMFPAPVCETHWLCLPAEVRQSGDAGDCEAYLVAVERLWLMAQNAEAN